jgi:hypothetical protein
MATPPLSTSTDDGELHPDSHPLVVALLETLDERLLGDEALDRRHALQAAQNVLGDLPELLLVDAAELKQPVDGALDGGHAEQNRQPSQQRQPG